MLVLNASLVFFDSHYCEDSLLSSQEPGIHGTVREKETKQGRTQLIANDDEYGFMIAHKKQIARMKVMVPVMIMSLRANIEIRNESEKHTGAIIPLPRLEPRCMDM